MNEIDKNEIKALKEQLKQTELRYLMAAQMGQYKAGFLARTSHELRSPLTSLISLHQLILSDLCDSPTEERDCIAQAQQAAFKLMKLLDAILAVAKTDYGMEPLQIQPLQVARVFADLECLTGMVAADRNLKLEFSPPDGSLYLLGERSCCRQVLLSLIDTAISILKDGSIQVTSHSLPREGRVLIRIDVDCDASIWSEPVPWHDETPTATPTAVKSFNQKLESSPGMKLKLSQNLLEIIQSDLTVLDLTAENHNQPLTRLECSFPLAKSAV